MSGKFRFSLRAFGLAVGVLAGLVFGLNWYWKAQIASTAAERYKRSIAYYDAGESADTIELLDASEKWMAAALQVPFARKEDIWQAHAVRLRDIEARAEAHPLGMMSSRRDWEEKQKKWRAVQKAREDFERAHQ